MGHYDSCRDLDPPKHDTEYIVVADRTSKVLKSTTDWHEALRYANDIRRGGGEVTIFKSTKG